MTCIIFLSKVCLISDARNNLFLFQTKKSVEDFEQAEETSFRT
jgi:hypothetical protein